MSFVFSLCHYDYGLFTRIKDVGTILLLLYVDDIIINGSDSISIIKLKALLSSCFEMKDLSKLHYFLGLEVFLDQSRVYIFQEKYISNLLYRSCLTDCKVASTPLESNTHLVLRVILLLETPLLRTTGWFISLSHSYST